MGKADLNIFQKNVPSSTEKLQNSAVGIAGCGGLGSNAAVALVRAGIGKLILIDSDSVEESNLNRQFFFQTDIGKEKVTALANHLKNINPNVTLDTLHIKLEPNNIKPLFKDADLLIEAFDKAEEKHWLIESWCKSFPHKPIICASGLSGIGKTERLKVKHAGQIYICGDEESDMSIGLCSARVAIVANMQANVAIEILTSSKGK
ncbi:MAG: thiamine biosynthesis protein ThiF [Ignavibacteria bacterium RBG_13_36_8]|nr:MAG: thiamine biosynthesis protein ThiF [Ignavibacteria bacterium RBG_13_36_8]